MDEDTNKSGWPHTLLKYVAEVSVWLKEFCRFQDVDLFVVIEFSLKKIHRSSNLKFTFFNENLSFTHLAKKRFHFEEFYFRKMKVINEYYFVPGAGGVA